MSSYEAGELARLSEADAGATLESSAPGAGERAPDDGAPPGPSGVASGPSGVATPGDGLADLPLADPADPADRPSSSPSGVDAGADGGVIPIPEPTTIVSSVPSDGALGVLPDVVLVIDFGRAMNPTTVPGALVSDDIRLDGAAFAWNADNSVVQVTLAEPLPVASGTDAADVAPAICYSYRVSDAALDAGGQAVIPASVSFCTARRITHTVTPVTDSTLTGNFRSDGSYGDGACGNGANAVCVGDSSVAANTAYRGFLTFALTGVPESILSVDAALTIQATAVSGTPFDDLGALLVEQARFARIDAAAFGESRADELGAMRRVQAGDLTLEGNLQPTLSGSDERIQLRLRFADDTDQDGLSDHIIAPVSGVTIRLGYLIQ